MHLKHWSLFTKTVVTKTIFLVFIYSAFVQEQPHEPPISLNEVPRSRFPNASSRSTSHNWCSPDPLRICPYNQERCSLSTSRIRPAFHWHHICHSILPCLPREALQDPHFSSMQQPLGSYQTFSIHCRGIGWHWPLPYVQFSFNVRGATDMLWSFVEPFHLNRATLIQRHTTWFTFSSSESSLPGCHNFFTFSEPSFTAFQ